MFAGIGCLVALSLMWFRPLYSVLALVVAMALSVMAGEYILTLFVVPLILVLITLAEGRKLSVPLLAATGAWCLSIVLVRPYDLGLLVLLAPLLAIAYIFSRTAKRVLGERERDRERIAAARLRQREAVEAERKAIARDLHDIVAHDITIIAMQARAAGFSGNADVGQEALKVIGDTAKEALQDLRVMLNVLRTDGPVTRTGEALDESAANAASSLEILIGIEHFANRLTELGYRVRTEADPSMAGLSQSAQTALYRVLQESTTNIVKHAGTGALCRIEATVIDGRAHLEVANSLTLMGGSMLDTPGHLSSGIVGMVDRMGTFGGTLSAGKVDREWLVRAALPMPALASGNLRSTKKAEKDTKV
ncbi:sensor histidine kinase [Paeniglutamicibacter cryotolerans]|uniref:histidine kinase n=2 Tax=Paeniglutamicibacter cryotolerans TaxID=670079 RepID=A0A839QGC7_9MICC|nr:signal transduction histidine kinase [Paeniglutamicibacter cryotolerans]